MNIGDLVYSKSRKCKGVCKKVDETDKFLTYMIKFEDGTLAWYDKRTVDKDIKYLT